MLVCYRVRDTSTKWCCDQDWDEERWGLTRQKKRPPAQASSVLRVAFCLLHRALAFFFFFLVSGELPICDLLACCWLRVDGLRISHYCPKMPLTYHTCNSWQNLLPYFTIVRWRHGSYWNSFQAACSPIARLTRVSSPCVTQQFFAYHHRRLQCLSRPAWRLTRRSKSVSTCILVGFSLLWGYSNVFRSQRETRATPGKRHSARPVRSELFSIGLQAMTRAI